MPAAGQRDSPDGIAALGSADELERVAKFARPDFGTDPADRLPDEIVPGLEARHAALGARRAQLSQPRISTSAAQASSVRWSRTYSRGSRSNWRANGASVLGSIRIVMIPTRQVAGGTHVIAGQEQQGAVRDAQALRPAEHTIPQDGRGDRRRQSGGVEDADDVIARVHDRPERSRRPTAFFTPPPRRTCQKRPGTIWSWRTAVRIFLSLRRGSSSGRKASGSSFHPDWRRAIVGGSELHKAEPSDADRRRERLITHWAPSPFWSLEEGAVLAFDLDPKEAIKPSSGYGQKSIRAPENAQHLLDFAYRAFVVGSLDEDPAPIDFMKWARTIGVEFHPDWWDAVPDPEDTRQGKGRGTSIC